jgi:hypothetical protein
MVQNRGKKPRRSPERIGGAGTEKRPIQVGRVTDNPYLVNLFLVNFTK